MAALLLRVVWEADVDGEVCGGTLYTTDADHQPVGKPIAKYRATYTPGFPTSEGLAKLEALLAADQGAEMVLTGPIREGQFGSFDYLVASDPEER